MGKVIAIANMKGGVGKTTLACLFLMTLPRFSNTTYKILAIDLDPQANLTGIIIPPKLKQYSDQIHCVPFFNGKTELSEHIYSSKIPNVDMVPSYIDLAITENEIRSDPLWPLKLKTGLDSVKHAYDIVLIDCPPNIGTLTIDAIVAADSVVVPVTPDTMAMVGLTRIKSTTKQIKALNAQVEVDAVVVNMVDKRYSTHMAFVQMINKAKDMPKIIGPMSRRAAIQRLVESDRSLKEALTGSDTDFRNEVRDFVNAMLEIAGFGGVDYEEEKNRTADAG